MAFPFSRFGFSRFGPLFRFGLAPCFGPFPQSVAWPDPREERRLTLAALAIGWLGQLALGLALTQLAPVPERPLLIDRHRCDPAGWRQLVARYSELHRQHAWQQQRFRPVLASGVFGLQRYPEPPDPARLVALAAVGEGEGAATAALRRRFPAAVVLACDP